MKRFLILLIKITVSSVLVGILLNRFGIQKIADLFLKADPIHFLFAGLVLMGSHVLGSVQWWVLLSREAVVIPWRKALSFYFVGLFFNNILPSGMGGDMFRMLDIKRYTKNGASAVSTVFLDRLLGLFVLSTLAVISSPWILFNSAFGHRLMVPISILLLGWLFLCILMFSKRCARRFAKFLCKLSLNKLVCKVRDVYDSVYTFGRSGMLLPKLIVLSLCIQSLRIMTHYFLGRAVGIDISPVYFFMFIPVVAIMASLPVSLGGLGLREQTGVVLFGVIGVPDVSAAAMEFMAYITSLITTLPGGLIFIFRKNLVAEAHALSDTSIPLGDAS